jgi:hypothetical protein
LPQAGDVLIRMGGRVEPEDVVAKAFVTPPPLAINVARALAIPPALVERAMRREVGNKVTQGEVLARTSPIGGRTCSAPASGLITSVDPTSGYVTISPDPEALELRANIRGVVMEVLPGEGVVIETPAAQVYGAFGIGNERNGVLRLQVTDPGEIIQAKDIDSRCAYAILIGGAGISAAALKQAVKEQVCGIIVGGIDEKELRTFLGWANQNAWKTGSNGWHLPNESAAADPGLTLIVTEGFGERPMSSPIFDLLSAQDRQEAMLEGRTMLRRPMRRPRVVIPLMRSAGAQLEPSRPQLRAGARVRLLNQAHLGQIAQVRAVANAPRRTASGIQATAVEVLREDGTIAWVPQTSVEVVS